MKPASRLSDLAKGLGALAVTAGLVLGVPAALWTQIGWPLPSALPTWSELLTGLRSGYLSDQVLIDVLAVVCWLAWAQLVVALAAETLAARRGRRFSRRLPIARPLRTAAARLVATITLLGSLAGPRTAVAAPVPSLDLAVAAAEHPAVPDVPVAQTVQAPSPGWYVVQPRDDLWSLAERHLGDPYRWTEIHTTNRGRLQHDGQALGDPDMLQPGWTLEFPSDAVGLPPAPTATAPDAEQEPLPPPPPPTDAGQEGPPVTAPDPRPAEAPTRTSPLPDPAKQGVAPADTLRREGLDARPAPAVDHQSPRIGPLIELPTGSLVSAALATGIGTALAAARLQTRRRRRPTTPRPGISHAEPLATDVVRRLRRAVSPASDDADTRQPLTRHSPPGTVTAAGPDGQPILLDLTTQGGLTLTGPGAEAAGRGMLVDLLASATPGTTHVLLADRQARLLPGAAPFPGLDVSDLADAVSRLEVEVLARTRLLDTAEMPDWRTLVHANPADPVPALLLVAADPDRALLRRLYIVAGLGRSLGLGTLLLGRDLDATTRHATVDDSGTITATEPAHQLDDLTATRLPTLTPEEAADLLAVLAAGRDTSPRQEHPVQDGPAGEPFPVGGSDGGKAISVTLFGPYDIEAGGAPVRSGLRNKARELLALLLLHPRGITLEQATAALWPDADPARGTERFRTVLGNLRSRLRVAADLPAAAIVDHLGSQRYQADAELFDCDLWRFQHALARAAATDVQGQVAALEAAAAAYTGELLEGVLYEWVVPAREDLRRRALDALACLATLHQKAGDTTAALAALEQAITHDAYAEALYQRIIRLQAALGQPDAARRTYSLLEARLAELDAEPEPATTALLTDLLSSASAGQEHLR